MIDLAPAAQGSVEPIGTPTGLTMAVVIPSFNRPGPLRACLQALVEDSSADLEIVVVDDGSPEPLAPVCAAFGARVRCLRQANRGPAAARNVGVRATRAPVVAFIDDDCRPRPGWAAALHAAQAGDPDRLVGGRVENALNGNLYASTSQALCDHLYDYYGAGSGTMPFFTTNNLACERARFEQLGGFDESFPLAAAEDRDFSLRWRAAGGSLHHAPDAIVDHAHDLDLGSFWRQHRNYGRGARHLHRLMRARGDGTPRVEPLRFYLGLLAAPLRYRGRAPLLQVGLLACSQLAMVSGYTAELRAERARDSARPPVEEAVGGDSSLD